VLSTSDSLFEFPLSQIEVVFFALDVYGPLRPLFLCRALDPP